MTDAVGVDAALQADQAGDGFPVVMLHGLGGSSNTFQPLMGALGNYATCRLDLPGAARSPVPSGRLTIDTLTDAVARWIDGQGHSRFFLAGHSMGTLLCQYLAARWPDRVAGMVLFGALTAPPDGARTALLARADAARTTGMAGIADQIVAQTLAPAAHADSPAAVAFVRETIMRQPPEGYARHCEALSAARAADHARIAAPTLLVTGADDPVAPVSMARLLGERIENAALDVIPRCGHWTPLERPGDCSDRMAAFLQRQPH